MESSRLQLLCYLKLTFHRASPVTCHLRCKNTAMSPKEWSGSRPGPPSGDSAPANDQGHPPANDSALIMKLDMFMAVQIISLVVFILNIQYTQQVTSKIHEAFKSKNCIQFLHGISAPLPPPPHTRLPNE